MTSRTGAVSGALRSAVPGRTDRHPIDVEPDSYVIPADVVSALGEGNTEAGYAVLDAWLAGLPGEPPGHASGGRVRADPGIYVDDTGRVFRTCSDHKLSDETWQTIRRLPPASTDD